MRTIIGILLSLAILTGLAVRTLFTCRLAQLVVLVAILWTVAGCAAVPYALEHGARQCHKEAWTVAAMTECSRLYPQHNGTVTDTLAQPVSTLERIIQHKDHNHE